MTGENSTLGDILQLRARRQPEQTAFIYLRGGELDEIRITYAELDRKARAVAATIQAHCQPGDRVIMLYPPGLEFIAAFFGCLYAGVIAVPAYPPRANRNLSRLQAIVDDCQAVMALTTAQIGRSIQAYWQGAAELRTLRLLTTDTLDEKVDAQWQKSDVDPEAVAFLQYTSGSTGTPKGVMVSHRNLVHNSQCTRDRWGHSTSSVGVCWLPQFHDLGLIIGILQPVYVGYKAVLLAPTAFIQKPYRWLNAISHYRGTTTCGPNFSFDLCVQKITPKQRETLDLSCLETVANGAEPVLAETLENFSKAFGPCGFESSAFRSGYGLAEATVFVTITRRSPDGPSARPVHKAALEQHRVVDADEQDEDAQYIMNCGSTADDQELVIVNPDLHVRCNPDQIGEIWVKGPSVAHGYWNRPEESTNTFHAVLSDTKEGPFLRTGDLGFLRDDELHITGRTKDLIIVRGRNHYPQDIERTVVKAHPALRPHCTAAFSILENNEERVVVVQELNRDYAEAPRLAAGDGRRSVDLEQVLGDIFQSVAEEHELSLYAILLIAEGGISKTSSGKIQRSACKQRYEDGTFDIVQQFVEEAPAAPVAPMEGRRKASDDLQDLPKEDWPGAIESVVMQIAATLAGRSAQTLDPNAPLRSLGLDSLRAVQLKTMLEEEFSTTVRMANIFGNPTIRKLATMLLTHLTDGSGAAHAGGSPKATLRESVTTQPEATREGRTSPRDAVSGESRQTEETRLMIERELAEIEAQEDD